MQLSPTGIPYSLTDTWGYSAMLSVLTSNPRIGASELAKRWPACVEFSDNLTELHTWLHNFSALYQLSLHGDAIVGWYCKGSLLRRRLCILDCLAFLHRYRTDKGVNRFSASLQRHLSLMNVNRASYDNINLTALFDYCARALGRPCHWDNHAILIDSFRWSLCDFSEPALNFSLTQLEWIRAKAEYSLVVKILSCWQRHNRIQLHEYACEFWALLLYLTYAPEEHDFTCPCQRDLLQLTREFLREFSQSNELTLSNIHQPIIPLYCHFHYLAIRQYLALAPVVPIQKLMPSVLLKQQIVQTLFSIKYCLIRPLPSEEIYYLAEKLVVLITPLLGYQRPNITILTNGNYRLEHQLSLEISASHLLPINFHYQSIANFQRYGASNHTALVLSLYPCRLPLYCPPILQVELPFNRHHKQYLSRFLHQEASRPSLAGACRSV